MARVRLGVITAMQDVLRLFFWVVTPCGNFGGCELLEQYIASIFIAAVSIEGTWQII
jgi:hypothetical protein